MFTFEEFKKWFEGAGVKHMTEETNVSGFPAFFVWDGLGATYKPQMDEPENKCVPRWHQLPSPAYIERMSPLAKFELFNRTLVELGFK